MGLLVVCEQICESLEGRLKGILKDAICGSFKGRLKAAIEIFNHHWRDKEVGSKPHSLFVFKFFSTVLKF